MISTYHPVVTVRMTVGFSRIWGILGPLGFRGCRAEGFRGFGFQGFRASGLQRY